MSRFRPLVGFSLFCLALFVVLIGLGVWQLERLQWKRALIAEMNRNMAQPPVSLDAALSLGDAAEYRPVALDGRFDNRLEVYVFATGPQGAPVYHVLTPLRLDDHRVMLVDRGVVPLALRDPSSRPGSEPVGQIHIVGIWRTADRPGVFTPAPDTSRRIWYARDVAGIARIEHLTLAAPAIIEASASPHSVAWPKAGQTRVDLPNDHLQYAITWFLLAGALVVIWFAFHRARGRFGSATDS
jgi:surfeit locus 1 family protein